MTKRKWNKKAAANVTRNVTSLKGHECDLGCQLFKEGGVPGSVKGWAVAASSSAPAPPPRLLRPGWVVWVLRPLWLWRQWWLSLLPPLPRPPPPPSSP